MSAPLRNHAEIKGTLNLVKEKVPASNSVVELAELRESDRILLLQGPMGGFFARFANFLRSGGAQVKKINFNGGDWLFYRGADTTNYRGTMEAWPEYISRFLLESKINKIFLFGDCRYYHREAIKAARDNGIEVYVFEEGYIRPNYVTLEKGGVNGFSSLSRVPDFYAVQSFDESEPTTLPAQTSFRRMAFAAMAYYLAGAFLRPYFWNYEHHKSFSVLRKGTRWCKSGIRKLFYARRDARWTRRLAGELSKRYFLVPLQVHSDAQVTHHSSYKCIEDFIREVVASFDRYASQDAVLVFKHHPMDRGGRHYGRLIKSLCKRCGNWERVIYAHEIHLPTALDNARGVVVINSTVGLSALLHDAPVKAMGDAIYDMPGLTFQRSLDEFWNDPGGVDQLLLRSFRNHVIYTSQLNGSFFGRDPFPEKLISVRNKEESLLVEGATKSQSSGNDLLWCCEDVNAHNQVAFDLVKSTTVCNVAMLKGNAEVGIRSLARTADLKGRLN